jgi:hypothetical protein
LIIIRWFVIFCPHEWCGQEYSYIYIIHTSAKPHNCTEVQCGSAKFLEVEFLSQKISANYISIKTGNVFLTNILPIYDPTKTTQGYLISLQCFQQCEIKCFDLSQSEICKLKKISIFQ